jgi:Ser/Thr protein kinase RdoA (MazF antagonist)
MARRGWCRGCWRRPGGRGPRYEGRRGREAFLRAAAALGLAVDRIGAEIDELVLILNGTGYFGLVHGDACPDNVRFLAEGGRIFDFETSGWGRKCDLGGTWLTGPA